MSEAQRPTPPTLSPEHERSLTTGSSITPDVITARGYRTVTVRAELGRLGFTDQQRNVPALLIPLHGVLGGIVGYQTRPDQPRIEKGKAIKYETPSGARMVLDVHPSMRHLISDPSVPLYVTEGVKKGDALASRHVCGIALLGVWNWRGTNDQGGKTALPDWEQVALKGRRVLIVFDSDVMLKEAVSKALVRLGGFLKSRGAEVFYVYLPAGEHGTKMGVDDFLAAGHGADELYSLASAEPRQGVGDDSVDENAGPYVETESGIIWQRPTIGGSVPTPLTNFNCRITSQVAEDDGAEIRRRFDLEAWLAGRRIPFSLPAAQFAAMNWAAEHLGARAIMYPGFGLKEHSRVAIQTLSGDIVERQVFTHTGFRKIGDIWAFLHAAGAIGPAGPLSDIEVALPDTLARYSLPNPPDGETLKIAVRASLRLLDVAPDRVTVPVFAATYRAPLGAVDTSVAYVGPTGAGKSEIAALGQQHYGAGMDARHLPANWFSTGNALEGLAFLAKDAVIVVDDFTPTGSINDIQRQHREADRVHRGQGNNAGRQRMRPDATLRPTRPPRGLIVSTGEDVPQGQSLRARMVVVDVGPGDMDWQKLTECQADARQGLYAQALTAYVGWVAASYDEIRGGLDAQVAALRDQATRNGTHRRSPANLAQLGVGLKCFLAFTVDQHILSDDEAGKLWDRCWTALEQLGTDQPQHQDANEPTRRFRELLQAALASGAAHIADREGQEPKTPEAWGWRKVTVGTGNSERAEWRPLGDRVGWVDGDNLYLEADAAFGVVQRLGRNVGEGITIQLPTLKKRLHQKGLLASTETRGGQLRLEVRPTLESRRRRVLHVDAATFLSGEAAQVAQQSQDSPAAAYAATENDADRVDERDSGAPNKRSAKRTPARRPGDAAANGSAGRRDGPIGPKPRGGNNTSNSEAGDPKKSRKAVLSADDDYLDV